MTGGRKLARHDFCGMVGHDFAVGLTRAAFRGDMPADQSEMANLISRLNFTIQWGQCDPSGIVFNSRYYEYFDCGTWTLFEAALGVKRHELFAAFAITGMPLVDVSTQFLTPAWFGDAVELTSQVAEFRRSSFDVLHRLFVRGAMAVESRETRVWAGRDPADPSKMKAQPIPAEVAARFQVAS